MKFPKLTVDFSFKLLATLGLLLAFPVVVLAIRTVWLVWLEVWKLAFGSM